MLGTIKCNTRTPLRLLPNASLRQRPATSPAALTIRFTIRRGAANDYARAHAARNKKQEKQKRETASHAGASHTQSLRTRREKTRTGRNDNTHHSPLESQLPPAAALRLSSLASPPHPYRRVIAATPPPATVRPRHRAVARENVLIPLLFPPVLFCSGAPRTAATFRPFGSWALIQLFSRGAKCKYK